MNKVILFFKLFLHTFKCDFSYMTFSFTNGKISRAHCRKCNKTIFITTEFDIKSEIFGLGNVISNFSFDKISVDQGIRPSNIAPVNIINKEAIIDLTPISYVFSFTEDSYAEFQKTILEENLYPIFHKALFHMLETPIKTMERDGKKESPYEGSFKILEHGLFFKCKLFLDFNSRKRVLTFTELISLDVDEYLDEIIRIKKLQNSEIKLNNDASNKLQ